MTTILLIAILMFVVLIYYAIEPYIKNGVDHIDDNIHDIKNAVGNQNLGHIEELLNKIIYSGEKERLLESINGYLSEIKSSIDFDQKMDNSSRILTQLLCRRALSSYMGSLLGRG